MSVESNKETAVNETFEEVSEIQRELLNNLIEENSQMVRMSTALIGHVEPFVPGGNFKAYEDRIRQLVLINGIEDNKKAALLITIMGADVYEILVSLALPKLPSELTFDEILAKLTVHFKPKVNKRAERYKFNKIVQEQGETISDFIVRLKAAAQNCEFGDFLTGNGTAFKNNALDDALIDRFIVGLCSEKIQQKLLNEKSATFDEVCKTAVSMEVTQREVKAMQPMGQHAVNADVKAIKSKSSQNTKQCRRCGRRHDEQKCPAKNWQCFACGRQGHTSVVCFSKKNENETRGKSGSNNKNNSSQNGNSSNNNKSNQKQHVKGVYHVEKSVSAAAKDRTIVIKKLSIVSPALTRKILVNGIGLNMEIDSGAVLSLISNKIYHEHFQHFKLESCTYNLVTVTGDPIDVSGQISVAVRGASRSEKVNLIVTSGQQDFTPLYGRAWLDVLYPNWRENMFRVDLPINAVCSLEQNSDIVSKIKTQYPFTVSDSSDQAIVRCEAVLLLKENATPIFHAPYSVPYKLRDRFKKKINELVKSKRLEPVKYSDWASPVVIVPKNGDFRLCIDCKVTINRYLRTEHYPLPKIDDIFANLSDARVFCVLDLKGAYQQIVVAEKSQELLTINTMFGLFRYTRLPFGVASAPSIFQQEMDTILKGIENVHCYLDDIIIGGKDTKHCRQILFAVLKRLNEFRVRINLTKCRFLVGSVTYLGHILSQGEIRPNPDKVKAVTQARQPNNVKELKSFLGLVNYYGKFIPNLSSELNLLYKLTKKDVKFMWDNACQSAFEHSKELLTSDSVLVLYDQSKPIIVASDASPIGLGGILSHEMNGHDKPVYFVSSTLTDAQRNYSQIHREALAIIFAITKFHDYIYGHTFTLHTDQQALSEIFHPEKSTPSVAAARLQRWSIILSMYSYKIKHRSATKMTHVDALSRLPLEEDSGVEPMAINLCQISGELIDKKLIAARTSEDKILSKVYEFVMDGWPSKEQIDPELITFYNKNVSLACDEGCLYYGNNVIIPTVLQKVILELIHESHVGIVKMKMIARSYVWWPSLQKDIESFVHNCEICQSTRNVPKEIVKTKWSSTNYPFERIHLDFFYLKGTHFLILIDAYSKFVEIAIMRNTVANSLIEKLNKFFDVFGLPTKIVSDNGPPFNSSVFRKYCESNGIIFQNSPPYHAQSNGLAERGVQTAKKALIRLCMGESALTIQEKVDKYLLKARNSPNLETGRTPAECIFAYKPKIKLDLINDFLYKNNNEISFRKNEQNNNCKKNEPKQKSKSIEDTIFKEGEHVYYRNHFKNWVKWIPAIVKKRVSSLTYLIDINGSIRFVQKNQLRYPSANDKHSPIVTLSENTHEPTITNNNNNELDDSVVDLTDSIEGSPEMFVLDSSTSTSQESNDDSPIIAGRKRRANRPSFQLRRSKRNRKRVKRFGQNVFDNSFH